MSRRRHIVYHTLRTGRNRVCEVFFWKKESGVCGVRLRMLSSRVAMAMASLARCRIGVNSTNMLMSYRRKRLQAIGRKVWATARKA